MSDNGKIFGRALVDLRSALGLLDQVATSTATLHVQWAIDLAEQELLALEYADDCLTPRRDVIHKLI